MTGRITLQHYEWKALCPACINDIEQVFISHAARLANEGYLVGIQNNRSTFGAAVRGTAVNVTGYLEGVGRIKNFGVSAADLDR
jgi:hypothetical protein